ncbi:MAG: hypothetical protein RIQ89_1027 [Bacteroidota bacterium]|jgi:2,3-bisphosphoglycerate-independent phosphoglycerate mutase
MNQQKACLMILDGWGNGRPYQGNAITEANTPVMDHLITSYPTAELITSGEDVGLPPAQMGNSEVGHLNLGAGRVVYQDLVKINVAIRNGSFFTEQVLVDSLQYAKEKNKAVHLLGLVSNGGVHAHLEHLKALCKLCVKMEINFYVHCITDGRDTDPKSGLGFIQDIDYFTTNELKKPHSIKSICGRYYAMDRDKRWERVKLAYDLLVNGVGEKYTDPTSALQASYANGITDEFMLPAIIGNEAKCIETGDVVVCFNFRTDRCREITQVLTQQAMPEYGMSPLELYYVTMTNYDENFKNIKVIYDKDNLVLTMGEVLAANNRSQLRIAETEKYPHVTFFFNGGREQPFEKEDRIMIPSPKVATYDLQPEMSAQGVAAATIQAMEATNKPDFICVNFANADMVGHTGDLKAVIKAVETVDHYTGKIVSAALANGYQLLIIADHGNAEFMINDDGSPNTAHTTNNVPIIFVGTNTIKLNSGRLADVAPTLLAMMNLAQPKEMTGKKLIQ